MRRDYSKPNIKNQNSEEVVLDGPDLDSEVQQTTLMAKVAVVTHCPNLNVREAADSNSKIITTLPRDTRMTVLSLDKEWAHIKTNEEIVGFVMRKFIEV